MFPIYLKPGIKFKLDNTVYEITKRLPNSNIEVIDQRFQNTKIFTQNELIKYLSDDILRFEAKGKNVSEDNNSKINTFHEFNDIEDLKRKEQAIFKFEVIKPLLQIPYPYRKFEDVAKRVEEINKLIENPKTVLQTLGCNYYHKVSTTSTYRWLQEYDSSGGDFRSLIPSYHRCGGKAKARIDQKVLDFMNESIKEAYLDKRRISMKELRSIVQDKITEHNEYSRNKLVCPPLSTFARYVSKIPEYELVCKRIGKKTAENKFSPIGNGVSVTKPLERVEIDHTPIDVILVDTNGENLGRPYLVLAIDKFTRYPLGFSIGIGPGVGWDEVKECIKHILTEKSYVKEMYPFIKNAWSAFGIPQTVVVDNGLEFKNNAMRDASYQIGFVLQYCPPRVPQWKGSIERFFGTSNTGLFHTLPGTTRSNPKELGDDENPSKNACLTFSVFLALVHKWIIDIYAQDLNRGANGIPAKIWDDAIDVYPVAWPNSTSEVAVLLGKTAHRQISRRGIEIEKLRYNSLELNKLLIKFSAENRGINEKFKTKYDPQNLGEIYVYDHIINKEWIKVPCTNTAYAKNLSEWEHKEARAYAKRKLGKVNEEALSKARVCIRKMIENGIGYTQKQIAKANKVNSSNEISNYMNSRNTNTHVALAQKPDNYNNNSSRTQVNIADFGRTLEDNDIIIPQSVYTEANTTPVNNVVDIKSKKEKKVKNTKKSNKVGQDTIEESLDATFNDLSGFKIATDMLGVDDNAE